MTTTTLTRGLLVANIVLFTIVFTTAFRPARTGHFEELDVERINVVEPDGTVRLVIANRARTPGPIEHGEPFGYATGQRAGLIFYNDEYTEAGGLIFSGKQDGDQPTAVGSLTFDQFNRDQNIALQYVENNGRRRAGLAINEYPTGVTSAGWSAEYDRIQALTDSAAKREALAAWRANGGKGRLYVGRQFDGAAVVVLSDASGRGRLRLRVDSLGAAAIEFLDDSGKVGRSIGMAP